MSESDYILIKGARVNNLKNIDVKIPRNKLVVITGLSGSGKSSLAFDTLYAEGQRRYVESLSSYARQFLGRMSKPECDYIKGIPPAIAIEQKVNSRNPRSTVGTSTEIYEYLRLLYARVGHTFSPVSGQEVKKHSPEDIVNCMLEYPDGTRFTVLTPIVPREGRTLSQLLDTYQKEGFTRLEVNGQTVRIDEYQPKEGDTVFLMIDRMTAGHDKDTMSRLTDSAETAMYEGDGACLLRFYQADGSTSLFRFSTKFEADGITFEEPTDQMFSFNSPIGACPVCEGFGRVIGIDEHLVVPNRALSVYDGAVVCWRGEKMGEWRDMVIRGAEKAGFPIFTPYYELTDEQRRMLWEGTRYFEGINAFFKMLQENQYKIQYRVMLARYRGKTICPACHGTRLKPEANYVRVGGKSISQLVDLPVTELKVFFDHLKLNAHDAQVAARILAEINSRIRFLIDVGLGYLTLNRLSNSLSGGESQRINLATSLGSSLVGSLYILDEPSIGLHSRDTDKLIRVLRQLQQLGNTVVVVEHDEEIIRAADYIIDIGPKAGRLGGEVVYQGNIDELTRGQGDELTRERVDEGTRERVDKGTRDKSLAASSTCQLVNSSTKPSSTCQLVNSSTDTSSTKTSYTVRYLLGEETIAVPAVRRPWNSYIEIRGARENNLKGVDVRFPLNVMTVVTGVSGSGKSTLVRDIFYRALKRELDECSERPGEFVSIGGDLQNLRNVEFIDQNPIGKSSRSNPVTYLKAYDDIRKLYANQPLSKQMGYTPGTFSFNSEGGRCEECKGEGTITVEMQFMADLVLECEACHGKRFKQDVLEVRFHDANIYDVLEMTVDQAIEFFDTHKQRKIARKLQPLQDVGLGYIKLGQSSSTLSGGENQRVKLAYYLAQEKADPTMFIFDEPTTGLHFHDIRRLLEAFDALLRRGHSITIIEHNLDVVKCADHVIDLGPEGGDGGGNLVVAGTPEEVAACAASYTGQFLREKLEADKKR